jgi:hypothetical protein
MAVAEIWAAQAVTGRALAQHMANAVRPEVFVARWTSVTFIKAANHLLEYVAPTLQLVLMVDAGIMVVLPAQEQPFKNLAVPQQGFVDVTQSRVTLS